METGNENWSSRLVNLYIHVSGKRIHFYFCRYSVYNLNLCYLEEEHSEWDRYPGV